jgi:pimeloyl-ACP methyl ester carboxylesterase
MLEDREQPFVFTCEGQSLYGLLHLPSTAPKRAVLILHGWAGYRIGPGRLLVRTARALAQRGFVVLRFDFRGRGESEGDAESANLATMLSDARAALKALRETVSVVHVTPLGVCSGGEVALGLLREEEVDSCIFWSVPISTQQVEVSRQVRRTARSLGEYWRKLWRGETWRKLWRGEVHWRLVAKALLGRPKAKPAQATSAPSPNPFEGFHGPLLFLYGTADPDTKPSVEHYRRLTERHRLPAHFHLVEGANHNFYSQEWHREVIEVTGAWLEERER